MMGMKVVAYLDGIRIRVGHVPRNTVPNNFIGDLPEDFTSHDEPALSMEAGKVKVDWEKIKEIREKRVSEVQEIEKISQWNELSVMERMKQSFKGK
jgi:hypothetical protein